MGLERRGIFKPCCGILPFLEKNQGTVGGISDGGFESAR